MLTAGIARVDITPSVPIDVVGYSRRAEPARHIRAPLTATALALSSGSTTAAVIAADVPFLLPAHADRLRAEIADALGTSADHVMISVSHTHGGPTTHAHGVKIGGRQRERSAMNASSSTRSPNSSPPRQLRPRAAWSRCGPPAGSARWTWP